jgi:hypothetical protein
MMSLAVRRWVAVAPAAVLALTVLAACSSGGGSSTTAAGTSSGTTSSSAAPGAGANGGARGQFGAAFQVYTACLTKNGVTLPSRAPRVRPSGLPSGALPSGIPSGGFRGGFGGGGFGGGGFSSTAPSGVDPGTWAKAYAACASVRPSFTPGAGPGGGGIDATALAAYISCLSDHGVKVTGTGFAALRGLNRTDPTVAKALTTCAPLLPSRAPGGQAPSPSGSSTA